MLRATAGRTDRSISELDEAVKRCLAEDAEDVGAFSCRARERSHDFTQVIRRLLGTPSRERKRGVRELFEKLSGRCFHYKGVERLSEVYAELERAARDEILRSGGSLSHHHGVGKLRQPFLSRVFSPAALDWREKLKAAVDPENVLGCGNG